MDTTILLEDLKNNTTENCVSVIIPTHKLSPDRLIDKLEVEKTLKTTKDLLLKKFGKNNGGEELIKKLEDLENSIDYVHNNLGIGFFVSDKVSRLVKFPFNVKEKIIIGNNFEIRDVIYLAETLIKYYVLLINDKEIKLFEGEGDSLKIVKNKDFPLAFVDDYEYARAALGSSFGYSLKSTEKDKSIVKEQRLTAFIKEADRRLSKYISKNEPLIISGNNKELSYFKNISINYKYVAGKLIGNYGHESIQKLGELSFDKLKEYLKGEEDKYLKRLNDAIGKKLAVTGIVNVYKASSEGKGLILLVEKDYEIGGYVTLEDESTLYLNPPRKKHKILIDAVDSVMEKVIEKNGKVMIVENGQLSQFDGIALILRYW